jgi:hypothetical protein
VQQENICLLAVQLPFDSRLEQEFLFFFATHLENRLWGLFFPGIKETVV